jgi:hypothetical protein
MLIADEVRGQIHAFVGGHLSARELEGWLDSVAPELHGPGEERSRHLAGQVYVLLAELGYGDRTPESARSTIQRLLSEADAPDVHDGGKSAGIITGSSSITT